MKKTVILIAAAAMLCACTKENPKAPVAQAEGYGYISVGVDTDETTKADVTGTGLASWKATVTKSGSSDASYTGSAVGVGNTKFAAGTYTVAVSNYADLTTAIGGNTEWGDAYYEGSNTNVSVTAGQTTPATVSCGKAKNARFSVNFDSSFTDVVATGYKVEVTSPKSLTFNATNNYAEGTWAYFTASATVTYTLTYTLKKGGAEKTKTADIALGTAGTQKVFNVRANSNGQINLTISYDDTFTSETAEEVEIDAATGDEVPATPQA